MPRQMAIVMPHHDDYRLLPHTPTDTLLMICLIVDEAHCYYLIAPLPDAAFTLRQRAATIFFQEAIYYLCL